MDPRIEEHVRALEAHLRRVAGGKILDVDGGGDDRAWNPQALGDVPLHLRAENQLRLERRHLRFDLEIVVGDEAVGVDGGGGFSNLAREFARIGANADNLEAELGPRGSGRRKDVSRIAKDENPLPREIGRIDRPRPPWQTRLALKRGLARTEPRKRGDLGDERSRRSYSDRNSSCVGLSVGLFEP